MSQKIIIFGATSAIATESARLWAARGAELFLFARHNQKLDAVAQDLRARGALKVECAVADLSIVEDHAALIDRAWSALGGCDLAFVAYGSLPDQAACESDIGLAQQELHNNFNSVACLCLDLAKRFEAQGRGKLGVISSVAGDRGRQSNYVYGSAKGALTIFLAGLRNRLAAKGITVTTIKPGFVDTPMTAHIAKGALFASAEQVGKGIVQAIDRGANEVYLPWFWIGIMFVIRSIPEFVFKRLKL